MRPPLRRPLSRRARAEIVLGKGGAGVNPVWVLSFTPWGLSLLPKQLPGAPGPRGYELCCTALPVETVTEGLRSSKAPLPLVFWGPLLRAQ